MDVVQVAVETVTKAVDVMSRKMSALIKAKMDEKQDKETGKGLSTEDFTSAYKAMLDNAVTGVKGDKESVYRTGNVNVTPANIGAVPVSSVGTANGVAELDANGKVPSSQLPSYVDDVLEYASVSAFPATGESGKIYVATDTNLSYRWTGSGYVEISPSLALGETSSTAYRGDRGKTAYDHAQTTGNAHNMAKADIGLGNVDNTSDANKPVSTAQQAELDLKQNKETGKGLSTNDYTTAEKTKLSGIEAQANKTIIDTTLSNAGQAADAKTTGDSFSALHGLISRMEIYCEASGNPATFSDAKAANVKALVVTITPTQEGEGDPYPPGGGKNLLEITASSQTVNGVTFTVNTDVAGNVTGVTANGTATENALISLGYMSFRKGISYILSGTPSSQGTGKSVVFCGQYGGRIPQQIDRGNGVIFTPDEDYTSNISLVVYSGNAVSNVEYFPMIRRASDTDPTFAPYSNIRPISGVSSVSVTRTGENGANPQTVTVQPTDGSNPLTVYGGTLNVTTGELIVTDVSLTLTGRMGGEWDSTATHYGYYTLNLLDMITPFSTEQILSDKASRGKPTSAGTAISVRIANGNGRGVLYFRKDLLSEGTVSAANAWLAENPVQIVGSLETPVTYQLTPQQLATLHGYNAVSADAGTLDVTYRADPSITLGGS